MEKIYLLLFIIWVRPVFAQEQTPENIFTVKAKELPVLLYPNIDSLWAGDRTKFEVVVPKDYRIDTIVSLNATTYRIKDTLWFTALKPGLSMLKIFGKKNGSKSQGRLSYKKIFTAVKEGTLLSSIVGWGKGGAGIFCAGVNGGKRVETKLRCYFNGKRIDNLKVINLTELNKASVQTGFTVFDSMSMKSIPVDYFSMRIEGPNERFDRDTSCSNTITADILKKLSTCLDLDFMQISLYDTNGIMCMDLRSCIHNTFAPVLSLNGKVIREGSTMSLQDVLTSQRERYGFTLQQENEPFTNYEIAGLHIKIKEPRRAAITIHQPKNKCDKLPAGVFNGIRRRAEITLTFFLEPAGSLGPGLGKMAMSKEFNIHYTRTAPKHSKDETPFRPRITDPGRAVSLR